MSPRQRLFRSVNWALGLSLLMIALVMFGFLTCPATTYPIRGAVSMKVGRESPPDENAPEKEQKAWREKQSVASDAAHDGAYMAYTMAAIGLGVPVIVLLVVVCILLHRVRGYLRRGV